MLPRIIGAAIVVLVAIALIVFLSVSAREEQKPLPKDTVQEKPKEPIKIEKGKRCTPEELIEFLKSTEDENSRTMVIGMLAQTDFQKLRDLLWKGGHASLYAAKALAALGTKEAVSELLAVITKADEPENLEPDRWLEILTAAQGGFAEVKAKEPIEDIAKNHSDGHSRALAISQLASIDSASTISIEAMTNDGDQSVRVTAAHVLSAHPDKGASSAALGNALQFDPSPDVRRESALSLGIIGGETNRASLEKADVKETDAQVKQAIHSALESMSK